MKLHQKKFYSSEQTDRIIEQHARDNSLGFSEALREIIIEWNGEPVSVPVVGTINDDGSVTFKARKRKWSGGISIEEELARR